MMFPSRLMRWWKPRAGKWEVADKYETMRGDDEGQWGGVNCALYRILGTVLTVCAP